MNAIAASQTSALHPADEAALQQQLEALRLLLRKTAESLCAADPAEVEKNAAELTSLALAARSSWPAAMSETSQTVAKQEPQSCSSARELAIADLEQKRRLLLLSLFEARALYLAALRRWRRSLRLRRSLLNLHAGDGSYGEAEFSRWC